MTQNWQVVLILITLVVSVYALYKASQSGQAVNLGSVVSTIEGSVPLAKEIIDVAQTAVNSIEQMRRQPGNTMSNNEAFSRATATVRKWFPATEDVSDEQIITAINSAVLVASTMTNQIQAAKAVVIDAEVNKGILVDGKNTP